ncbi:MAG: hypothetical protein ACXVZV_02995 [Terriglobales bacterium]
MQREIEAKGIPTILITVVPAESKVMRPPRAIYPVGHQLGRVLGTAGDVSRQRAVLTRALAELEVLRMPGEIQEYHP